MKLYLDEFKPAVKWLQTSLVEEADDRNEPSSDDEDETVGVAILPLEEECIQAMEKENFHKVLKLLEIMPPGISTDDTDPNLIIMVCFKLNFSQ